MPTLQEARAQVITNYQQRTPKSAALYAQALRAMPGGDTRSSTFFAPYPTYIERGGGAQLTDVDGNVLLDFLGNYTSLIHGNAFPPVVEAARRQVELGSAWGAPNADQVRLATIICERVPSVELVRFTNSGTEATMQAIRAARAFTGRDVIVKIQGGYHGTHEAVSSGAGVPRGALDATIQVPFNDEAALSQVIAERGDQIAAVILEPMMGSFGMIPAQREYLHFVRKATQAANILMILDEVMTFRLDTGGTQAIYGVHPDLTSFAKIIGGGFPVGAFGGRTDIMALYDPRNVRVSHSGTFNGNPVTMAAGRVAMEHLTPDRIAHANALGDSLRRGLSEVLDEQRLHGQVTGIGSLVGIHLTAQPVTNHLGANSARPELKDALHLALINRGILQSHGTMLCTSTVMSESDITHAIEAFQDALVELKPALETECPELMR